MTTYTGRYGAPLDPAPGHRVVWLWLAASAFSAGYGLWGGAQRARMLARMSLGVYLALMVTPVTAGR